MCFNFVSLADDIGEIPALRNLIEDIKEMPLLVEDEVELPEEPLIKKTFKKKVSESKKCVTETSLGITSGFTVIDDYKPTVLKEYEEKDKNGRVWKVQVIK